MASVRSTVIKGVFSKGSKELLLIYSYLHSHTGCIPVKYSHEYRCDIRYGQCESFGCSFYLRLSSDQLINFSKEIFRSHFSFALRRQLLLQRKVRISPLFTPSPVSSSGLVREDDQRGCRCPDTRRTLPPSDLQAAIHAMAREHQLHLQPRLPHRRHQGARTVTCGKLHVS